MAWSVGVLTLGGSSLLYLLIQRGEATAVTSLLYLVPPCTALMAWAMFGESLTAGHDGGRGVDRRSASRSSSAPPPEELEERFDMKKTHRIAVIAGDGIGKEVMPEGLRVLEAAAQPVRHRRSRSTNSTSRSCDYYEQHGR